MAGGVVASAAAMGRLVRPRASRESNDLFPSSPATEVVAPPSPFLPCFAFPAETVNGKVEGDATGALTPSLPASGSPPPASSVESVIPSGMEASWNRAAGMKSDFVVRVGDVVFNVHKFPLYSKTEFFAAIAVHDVSSRKTLAKLDELPGGASTFLLVVNYCYGFDIEITVDNVAALRCAAEYLEMKTESRAGLAKEGSLMTLTDSILQRFLSYWRDAVSVLHHCLPLVNVGEGSEIIHRCVTAIAKACLITSVAKDGTKKDASLLTIIPTHESVLSLPLPLYVSLVEAMYNALLPASAIGASIEAYFRLWLANAIVSSSSPPRLPVAVDVDRTCVSGNGSIPSSRDPINPRAALTEPLDCEWLTAVTESGSSCEEGVASGDIEAIPLSRQEVLRCREIVEALVDLLPEDKHAVHVSTLVKLLRCSVVVEASRDARQRLQRMAGSRLDEMDIEDLNLVGADVEELLALIRAFNTSSDGDLGLESHEGDDDVVPFVKGRGVDDDDVSVKKVVALIDEYLLRAVSRGSWQDDSVMGTGTRTEGSCTRPLSADEFRALVQSVPLESRASHDFLFQAVTTWISVAETYLPAIERKEAVSQLCELVDPFLLSPEVAERASTMWDCLPLPFMVRVLTAIKAHLTELLDKQLREFGKVEREFHHTMEEMKGMEADLEGLRLKRLASDDTLAGMKRALEEEARETENSVRHLEDQIAEMENSISKLRTENEEVRVKSKQRRSSLSLFFCFKPKSNNGD